MNRRRMFTRAARAALAAMCQRATIAAFLVGGVTITVGARPVAAADADDCASWPGEMDPLPSTEDSDPFAARWARLRFDELVALADVLARNDPSAAHRLWRHAQCLAPRDVRSRDALAGLVPEREAVAAPVIARPAPRPAAPPRPPPADLERIDAAIAEASDALLRAQFRSVLDFAARARALLGTDPNRPEGKRRLAQLEIIASTAELALDREADAAQSLRRALRADPKLELDDSVPPKVRRLLVAVKESSNAVSAP